VECEIAFRLNGKPVEVRTDPLRPLLDVLREEFALKGAKRGCGEGVCGACSVMLNGEVVTSCLVPVGTAEGCDVVTIEGFRETERFEVLAGAFAEAGAVQCGFCTPGLLMAVESLLRQCPNPSKERIREAISGNLCRCTGYDVVVRAVEAAVARGIA
jgi:carbon-monoxide dehydrogenase small subunit